MADQQAGWYPDPAGDASKLRYWDGTNWTNDYSDAQAGAASAQPVQPVTPVQPQVYVQETTYSDATGGQTRVDQVYMQAPPQQSNGLAVASLVCGIAGLCIGIAGIVAIITGVMGRKNPVNRGMATAGLILGIIGVVGWIIGLIFWITVAASYY
ncbi:MAG: DUF2510 domain-containing protein [Coriobacteriales bacterium]|jgi:hypothetical protein|nr:DUF2510 domain-containing protein [Coriobacteriales bacterium]